MEEAKIRRLVQAAVHSPSPLNCQPWSFEWDGRALHVLHRASHAWLPSDPLWLMSFLGLGMVVEAMDIAASCERLETRVTLLFPDRYRAVAATDLERWATLSLAESARPPDPLAPEIPRRCSDRRPCLGGTLQAPVFDEVRAMPPRYPGTAFHLLESGRVPEELLAWFHSSLRMYTHYKAYWRNYGTALRLTERSARKIRTGFAPRGGGTPYSEALLELAQYHFWPLNLVIRALARKREPGKPLAMLAGRAGLGCISIDSDAPSRVVEAGRYAFRTWLRLGMEGYAVAPLGYYTVHSAVLDLHGPPDGMPPDVSGEFQRGSDLLRRAFALDASRLPIWLFSTGLVPGPMPEDQRTLRRSLEQCYRSTAGSDPA
ncbi:MAG TPA: hypothetical protein VND93_03580 [Myxococcales bacterium]|nr:hypothetical protein [Myxococcales bacterium]